MRQPTRVVLATVAVAWAGLLPDAGIAAAPTRVKSLAQFDAGFTHCEKLYPEMRGQGDVVYASLYRLKLDDELRAQLAETRKSAPYRADRRRAQQTIAKNAAASDVAQRADLQCQALRRELKGADGKAAPSAATGAAPAAASTTASASAAKR
jgi:hypothetical protein